MVAVDNKYLLFPFFMCHFYFSPIMLSNQQLTPLGTETYQMLFTCIPKGKHLLVQCSQLTFYLHRFIIQHRKEIRLCSLILSEVPLSDAQYTHCSLPFALIIYRICLAGMIIYTLALGACSSLAEWLITCQKQQIFRDKIIVLYTVLCKLRYIS